MRKHSALIIVLLIILSACNPDLDYKVTGYSQKIIVEGRIETGRSPVVYLSPVDIVTGKQIGRAHV